MKNKKERKFDPFLGQTRQLILGDDDAAIKMNMLFKSALPFTSRVFEYWAMLIDRLPHNAEIVINNSNLFMFYYLFVYAG